MLEILLLFLWKEINMFMQDFRVLFFFLILDKNCKLLFKKKILEKENELEQNY